MTYTPLNNSDHPKGGPRSRSRLTWTRVFSTTIRSMDPGLARATLRALQNHTGRGNAADRTELVAAVRSYIAGGGGRAAVNQPREDGFPICSAGGVDGGYWIAGSPQELDDYLAREPKARIKDLQEQVNLRFQRFGEPIEDDDHESGLEA